MKFIYSKWEKMQRKKNQQNEWNEIPWCPSLIYIKSKVNLRFHLEKNPLQNFVILVFVSMHKTFILVSLFVNECKYTCMCSESNIWLILWDIIYLFNSWSRFLALYSFMLVYKIFLMFKHYWIYIFLCYIKHDINLYVITS